MDSNFFLQNLLEGHCGADGIKIQANSKGIRELNIKKGKENN